VPAEASVGMPLEELLVRSLDGDRKPYMQSEIRLSPRQDIDVMWLEQHYLESTQNRDARFRVALARGPLICLVSMNYWSSRAAKLEPVWDHVLSTLQLSSELISDPTRGPVVQ
jgi:hypothetical protein